MIYFIDLARGAQSGYGAEFSAEGSHLDVYRAAFVKYFMNWRHLKMNFFGIFSTFRVVLSIFRCRRFIKYLPRAAG